MTKAAGAIDVRLAERRRDLELTLFGDGLSPEDIAAVVQEQRLVDADWRAELVKKTAGRASGDLGAVLDFGACRIAADVHAAPRG